MITVSETPGPIICEKGMKVLAEATYADAPKIDALVVPGGSGARREAQNPVTVKWLKDMAHRCKIVASVCTGSFLLVGTGVANGHRVTTHHDSIEQLRGWGNGADVVSGVRFIQDGKLVSAAGVTSGIEMSLWLVGQMWGPDAEAHARNYIACDVPPRAVFPGFRFPEPNGTHAVDMTRALVGHLPASHCLFDPMVNATLTFRRIVLT